MTKMDTSHTKGFYPNVKGKKRKMAELLVNPDCKMTVTEMCKHLKVSRSSFYVWQQEADFKGYIEFLIENFTDSELPNAWRALVKKANSGNIEALKLFFELKGKYKQEIAIDGGVVFISGEDEILD